MEILCVYCNHPVDNSNGVIYSNAPWEPDDVYHGTHWECENKMEQIQDEIEFARLVEAESRYRGRGMYQYNKPLMAAVLCLSGHATDLWNRDCVGCNNAEQEYKMLSMLKLAGKIAVPTTSLDKRTYWLGCVGIRKDGVMVSATNGSIQHMFSKRLDPDLNDKSCAYHAEGRTLRKMDKGGILYVTRVSRKDGSYCMARPCNLCQSKIRSQKIEKVYYTINDFQYGVWNVKSDRDIVYTRSP